MKKQIFLIGYRATGKSTVGKILAHLLSWKFFDTDEEIEKYTSKSIKQIFETYGEEKFREIESEVLEKISRNENIVVSTGGGIILKEKNREILKQGFVVLLESEIKTIIERMKKDNNRPALTNLPLEEEIKKTLSERQILYQEIFHIKILNENTNPENLALLIYNSIPFKNI